MKQFYSLLIPVSVMLLSACSEIPEGAYANRGNPESLLDVSSEVVTVELLSADSVAEIQEWVESDQPSRAEIYCIEGDVLCDQAEEAFVLYGVDYEWIPAQTSEVNLVYERVIAHDCDNSFVVNRLNPYNLNSPAFGCSVASNMVQMVSDRQQFVNPPLLGFVDGYRGVQVAGKYRTFKSEEYFKKDINLQSMNFSGSN